MDPDNNQSFGMEFQLKQLLQLLSGVNSVLIVLTVLLVAVAVYLIKPARWWAVAVLLDVSSFAAFGFNVGPVIAPLRTIQLYGRTVCAALLIVLMVPTVLSDRGWRFRLVLPATAMYLLFELVFALRSDDMTRMVLDGVTFVLIFAAFSIGMSRWLQSFADAEAAIKAIAWAGILFIIGSVIQLQIDPSRVTWQGRFFGTTGNPNHAGTLLAITLLPMLYLLLQRGTALWSRVFYGLAAGTAVILIVWSGSRTSMLMALVGVGIQFRRRLGSLALVGILCGAVALVILQTMSIDFAMSRALSTDDSRTRVWMAMLGIFAQSPLLGSTSVSVNSENSYLVAAVRCGVIGLIPLFLSLGFLALTLRRLTKGRRHLRQFAAMADLVVAGVAAELVGAMFEGYLVGVYTLPVLSLYVYFSLMSFLSDVRTVAAQGAEDDVEPVDYPVEPEMGFQPYAGHLNY